MSSALLGIRTGFCSPTSRQLPAVGCRLMTSSFKHSSLITYLRWFKFHIIRYLIWEQNKMTLWLSLSWMYLFVLVFSNFLLRVLDKKDGYFGAFSNEFTSNSTCWKVQPKFGRYLIGTWRWWFIFSYSVPTKNYCSFIARTWPALWSVLALRWAMANCMQLPYSNMQENI